MFEVSANVVRLSGSLVELGGSVAKKATVYALNDSARDVLGMVKGNMEREFDRPTKYALNAFMVWGAKVRDDDPIAEVKERPSVGSKHFLKVQERGGQRPLTALERLLKASLPQAGELRAVTPARGARLDASGNWARGQRDKVLKGLRGEGISSGKSEKSRRGRFFVPSVRSKLSPGIWATEADGTTRKVANFVTRSPSYEPRLGFYDGAEEVFLRVYPDHFSRIFDRLAKHSKDGSK